MLLHIKAPSIVFFVFEIFLKMRIKLGHEHGLWLGKVCLVFFDKRNFIETFKNLVAK